MAGATMAAWASFIGASSEGAWPGAVQPPPDPQPHCFRFPFDCRPSIDLKILVLN